MNLSLKKPEFRIRDVLPKTRHDTQTVNRLSFSFVLSPFEWFFHCPFQGRIPATRRRPNFPKKDTGIKANEIHHVKPSYKKDFQSDSHKSGHPLSNPLFYGAKPHSASPKSTPNFFSSFFATLRWRAHHRPSSPKMAYCTAYEGKEEIPIHRPFQRLALLVGEYIRQLFFDLQNPFCTDNHTEVVRNPNQ